MSGESVVAQTLTTIQIYFDRSEAVVAQATLEAHGIYAVLPDWYHVSNAWHYTVAMQGIRLSVRDEDAATALELLKPASDFEEPETEASITSTVIAFLCFFLTGVPYPVRRRKRPPTN